MCNAQNDAEHVLTQISAFDRAIVKRDAQIVTCFPQLRNGDSIRTADYPGFVVILPVREKALDIREAAAFKYINP